MLEFNGKNCRVFGEIYATRTGNWFRFYEFYQLNSTIFANVPFK